MIDRAGIAALVPHQGTMCLLDQVVRWSADAILCRTRSHLDAANPLRRDGRLAGLCGIEYALQAAALHGALLDGEAQRPGYLASARQVVLSVACLDDPALGALLVRARLLSRDPAALSYELEVASEAGALLVAARAVIALPRAVA